MNGKKGSGVYGYSPDVVPLVRKEITLIFTENAKFPIKKGYLRVNLCYLIH